MHMIDLNDPEHVECELRCDRNSNIGCVTNIVPRIEVKIFEI